MGLLTPVWREGLRPAPTPDELERLWDDYDGALLAEAFNENDTIDFDIRDGGHRHVASTRRRLREVGCEPIEAEDRAVIDAGFRTKNALGAQPLLRALREVRSKVAGVRAGGPITGLHPDTGRQVTAFCPFCSVTIGLVVTASGVLWCLDCAIMWREPWIDPQGSRDAVARIVGDVQGDVRIEDGRAEVLTDRS
ncbi:hypothetical protein [Amycolatopsis thermoflava]|uniref:hypothetical protein n=1 Tax=Amycolatopsis thermoflava TaxID=84480 RepID=UPI003663F901